MLRELELTVTRVGGPLGAGLKKYVPPSPAMGIMIPYKIVGQLGRSRECFRSSRVENGLVVISLSNAFSCCPFLSIT